MVEIIRLCGGNKAWKLLNKNIPSYLNRLARCLEYCRCLLSTELLSAHNPKINPGHKKADSIFVMNKRKKKRSTTASEEKTSLTSRDQGSTTNIV